MARASARAPPGFILGRSAINPNGWTKASLRAAMVKLKARYPELANITTDRECKPAYCQVKDNTYSGGSFLRGMVMGQFPADWEAEWRDVVKNNTAV